MEEKDILAHFKGKQIKPTANRILVFKALCREDRPMSLATMEGALPSMDKSSIFRVLTLFLENDMVHAFEDGRGVLNYELCSCEGTCNHTDAHIHFYCESCHQSFCMENLSVPQFTLPAGFTAHSTSFVIKGECPSCRKKNGRNQ